MHSQNLYNFYFESKKYISIGVSNVDYKVVENAQYYNRQQLEL